MIYTTNVGAAKTNIYFSYICICNEPTNMYYRCICVIFVISNQAVIFVKNQEESSQLVSCEIARSGAKLV